MTPPGPYESARALRRALEDRLKRHAEHSGIALDRLRKQVTHERLLARIAAVAPDGSWALKGGLALIARLGSDARATKDADTTWRRSLAQWNAVLERIVDCDLGDYFVFEIGRAKPLEAEGPEGGLRYSVVARLDGRVFERIQLDVNLLEGDPRPVERVALSNLMAFAGQAAPQVPMVPIGQHLAEKLHAYCRDYSGRPSSRARDLFDMLRIAQRITLPSACELASACRDTFELRETTWPPPPALPSAPADWAGAWSGFVADHGIPWTTLAQADDALRRLWGPVLSDPGATEWSAEPWEWRDGS